MAGSEITIKPSPELSELVERLERLPRVVRVPPGTFENLEAIDIPPGMILIEQEDCASWQLTAMADDILKLRAALTQLADAADETLSAALQGTPLYEAAVNARHTLAFTKPGRVEELEAAMRAAVEDITLGIRTYIGTTNIPVVHMQNARGTLRKALRSR